MLINPKRHGVLVKGNGHLVWVGGDANKGDAAVVNTVLQNPREPQKKQKSGLEIQRPKNTELGSGKRALELFKGTGSVGAELKKLGFEVISLDKDPKWGADHVIDILKWDFQNAYPIGYFDLITASPPVANSVWP